MKTERQMNYSRHVELLTEIQKMLDFLISDSKLLQCHFPPNIVQVLYIYGIYYQLVLQTVSRGYNSITYSEVGLT